MLSVPSSFLASSDLLSFRINPQHCGVIVLDTKSHMASIPAGVEPAPLVVSVGFSGEG